MSDLTKSSSEPEYGTAPDQAQTGSSKEKRLSREERDTIRARLNEIMISAVLEEIGAEPNQDRDRSKWKIPGKGNLITKGQAWKNVNTEKKGFGPVSLVRHALGFEYENQAFEWMLDRFGESFDDDIKASLEELSSGPKEFTPPDNNQRTIAVVRNYLVSTRGIPSSLVDSLIATGKIYSDDKKNCVFISTSSAEIRSTSGNGFKGCCIGSQVEWSGFRVTHDERVSEGTVALVEAAVDALSYRALFPGRFVMSTNGSGRFVLQYKVLVESIDHDFRVKAAFDADWAGDAAAQKLFNALYVRAAISRQLKIDEETMDEWFLEQKITFEIGESPHELFFNTGWEKSKKVSSPHLRKDEKGADCIAWEDAGTISPPMIRIRIEKDLHPGLLRGEKVLEVSKRGFDYVTEHMGLVRERPLKFKDWNDELKNLGVSYIQSYERCGREGFVNGLPPLPQHLEKFRRVDGAENGSCAAQDGVSPRSAAAPSLEVMTSSHSLSATSRASTSTGGGAAVNRFYARARTGVAK